MGHAPVDLCSQIWHIGEAIGIIWSRIDRFTNIFAHLILVDIKGRAELDIANMISPQVHMHQTWDEIIRLRFTIVMHPLYQRTGAVANAYNCNTHFLLTWTCHTR